MLKFQAILLLLALVLEAPLFAQAEPPVPPKSPSGETQKITRHSERLVIGSNFLLSTNEVIGDLVVIGGNADIQGRVEGELVVVGGKATISGSVANDAVVVLGEVEMHQAASIGGEAVFVGGPVKIHPEATIQGSRSEVPIGFFLPEIDGLKAWVFGGPLMGRLLLFEVTWPWFVASGFLLLYFLLLLLFPGAIRQIITALEERPVASACAGILTLIFFAPLLIVLAITLVGLLVIPFAVVALILALLFGKAALISFLGRGAARGVGFQGLKHPLPTFVIGAIMLSLTYTIPIFGLVAFGVATFFGLGGAMVALFGKLQAEQRQVPPASMLLPVNPAKASAKAQMDPADLPASAYAPGDTVLLPRAGFWKRTGAAAIDLLLLSLLLPVTGPFFVLLAVVYFVAMWTWKGTTVGSLVLGLKLVRTDGNPVNFAVAFVRSLFSLLSGLALGLGFFWAAWDKEKQSWHDKIAGTVVVQAPRDLALI